MSGDFNDPLLTGVVVFPPDTKPVQNARMHLRLEDVSLADAPATLVIERTYESISLPGGAERLSFELHGQIPSPVAHYSVRVLLDVDGDGEISAGDYISTESYPVLTFGHPKQVEISVRRV